MAFDFGDLEGFLEAIVASVTRDPATKEVSASEFNIRFSPLSHRLVSGSDGRQSKSGDVGETKAETKFAIFLPNTLKTPPNFKEYFETTNFPPIVDHDTHTSKVGLISIENFFAMCRGSKASFDIPIELEATARARTESDLVSIEFVNGILKGFTFDTLRTFNENGYFSYPSTDVMTIKLSVDLASALSDLRSEQAHILDLDKDKISAANAGSEIHQAALDNLTPFLRSHDPLMKLIYQEAQAPQLKSLGTFGNVLRGTLSFRGRKTASKQDLRQEPLCVAEVENIKAAANNFTLKFAELSTSHSQFTADLMNEIELSGAELAPVLLGLADDFKEHVGKIPEDKQTAWRDLLYKLGDLYEAKAILEEEIAGLNVGALGKIKELAVSAQKSVGSGANKSPNEDTDITIAPTILPSNIARRATRASMTASGSDPAKGKRKKSVAADNFWGTINNSLELGNTPPRPGRSLHR